LGVWGYQDDIDDEHQSFDEERLCALALLLRIEGQLTWRGSISVGSALLEDTKQSDEACLDLIDGTLQIFAPNNGASALALLLDAGHSVWTVAEDGQSLARVVSDESQATYEAATSGVPIDVGPDSFEDARRAVQRRCRHLCRARSSSTGGPGGSEALAPAVGTG
jgi:hypothetical protein